MISNRLDQRDLQRLADILAQPDPPELPGRGARRTHAGDPTRRQSVLLPLLIRWAQHRCLCLDPEPAIAPHRDHSARTSTLARTVTADTAMRTA